MLRLDSGSGEAYGDYQCLVPGCGWIQQNISHRGAHKHVMSHPELAFVMPLTPEARKGSMNWRDHKLSDEEKREGYHPTCRRCRQEMKVSTRTT